MSVTSGVERIYSNEDVGFMKIVMAKQPMGEIVQRRCSADESFETIDYFPPEEEEQQFSSRTHPLSEDDLKRFMDEDGRIIQEHALRKAVFLGGVDPKIRKKVWEFLFGLYPCTSTAREREALLLDYTVKYHEMKSRWKTMLVLSSEPKATPLEQGVVARYQRPEYDRRSVPSPEMERLNPLSEQETNHLNAAAAPEVRLHPADAVSDLVFPEQSDDLKTQIDFMKIQAQVYVNRQKIDVNNLRSCIRVIDKDVPRTDRDYHYFQGNYNSHLTVLRDILVTFSAFHPDVGYAQGMNDIVARFMVVFDSEVEAFWCFMNYMENIQTDFMEEGMIRKIDLVRGLLAELDEMLLWSLVEKELGDLYFCHRWLLLGFKREFAFDDSLTCFEILSSHHLELSSLAAENARRKEEMKEFENKRGVTRTALTAANHLYTFELFMCVSLLLEHREELMRCTDPAMAYDIINRMKIDLDPILVKSEKLFYKYCKKNVEDSFLMVEDQGEFPVKAKSRFSFG